MKKKMMIKMKCEHMGKRTTAGDIIRDKNIGVEKYPEIGSKDLFCLANVPGSGYQEVYCIIFLIVHFVRRRAKKVIYYFQNLKSVVLAPCRMQCEDTGMVATGIPQLPTFMNMQLDLNTEVMTAIQKIPRSSADERFDILEMMRRYSSSSSSTSSSSSSSCSSSSSSSSSSTSASSFSSVTAADNGVDNCTVNTWVVKNLFSRLPENYPLQTKAPLKSLYDLWYYGVPSVRI